MKTFPPATPIIFLTIQPDNIFMTLKRPKTALQLLHSLTLEEEDALVARDGKLLTPDRQIWPGDRIWIRIVASKG